MKFLQMTVLIVFFTLMLVFIYMLFPHTGIALRAMDDQSMDFLPVSNQTITAKATDNLKPLDDKELEDLSPAVIEKIPEPIPHEKLMMILKSDYDNAVCFKKCHQKEDFSPSDKTRLQWQMLIENNGHDIFKKIIWEDQAQKEQVMMYLLDNSRSSGYQTEGIGVWK
jgi:hypothetical protein